MKLREIERLRAAAVLMVMAVHWGPLADLLPAWGKDSWSGVDLFFVISGYVVTLSLVRLLPPLEAERSFLEAFDRSRTTLKTFYVRRFFRIMPAAITVMLACRMMSGVFPAFFGPMRHWPTEIFAFVGGMYNYVRPYHRDFKLGIFWSLAVEEHFYLILPILFVVFRTTSRRLAACAGLALFSILGRAMPKPDIGLDQMDLYEKFASHLRFDSLMAGVALALVAAHLPTRTFMPKRFMRFVLLPLVVLTIACLPSAVPEGIMLRVGVIALWGLSGLAAAFAGTDRGYVLSFPVVGRVLEHIGARSYALYMVHVPVLWIEAGERAAWPEYDRLVPPGDLWKRTLVLLVGALVLAEVLFRVVEQPCIRLGKRFLEAAEGAPVLSRLERGLLWGAIAFAAIVTFRHPLLLALGPRNLARGKGVTMSSHAEGKPDGPALTNGELEGEFGAHTQADENPWMRIDLGARTSIGAVRVHNRDDGYQEEAVPLDLQVSDDDKEYRTVATRAWVFTQEWPWRVRCDDITARYVRVRVWKKTPLCLSEVEVFASRAMAVIP